MNSAVTQGFLDTMEKTAVWGSAMFPRLAGAAGTAGAMGGVGAALGAAGGAVLKGYQGYRDARASGGSVGDGAIQGTLGALGGAVKGGVLGAAAGGVTGAAIGGASPGAGQYVQGALGRRAKTLADFGKRQVHAVTGWTPEGGVSSIGLGTGLTNPVLQGARSAREAGAEALSAARVRPADVSAVAHHKQLSKLHSKMVGLEKGVQTAEAAQDAALKSEQMGLTSIPGYLKSMHDNGVGATLRAGWDHQWKAAPGWMKAMTVAAPAVGVAQTLTSDDPNKGESIGRNLVGAALGGVTTPLPMVTGNAVMQAASDLGASAGRGMHARVRRAV